MTHPLHPVRPRQRRAESPAAGRRPFHQRLLHRAASGRHRGHADFDIGRYVGKWYEIARLDHSFERGLSDVSATSRVRPDGSVEVINRGYDTTKKEWREAGQWAGRCSRASRTVPR